MVRYFYILTEAKSYQTKIKLSFPCFFFFQTLADPNRDGTVLITIKHMKKKFYSITNMLLTRALMRRR